MYHTLIVVGNLGRDPEMRYLPSGTAVSNFSVATSHQFTNSQGEKVKETLWVRVSTFGKQAEVCNEYLKKGSKVLVEGRLNADKETGGPRVWAGTDGEAKASFEMTAQTVRFLSPAREGGMMDTAKDIGGVPVEEDVPF